MKDECCICLVAYRRNILISCHKFLYHSRLCQICGFTITHVKHPREFLKLRTESVINCSKLSALCVSQPAQLQSPGQRARPLEYAFFICGRVVFFICYQRDIGRHISEADCRARFGGGSSFPHRMFIKSLCCPLHAQCGRQNRYWI